MTAKVIAFFNHKGGVGKTTTVHNLGYGLAKLGQKVLLIDADPQMNLTAAVYGLSTESHYGDKETSKWQDYNEKHTSLHSFLDNILLNKKSNKIKCFKYTNPKDKVAFDLLRGDIQMNSLDASIMGMIQMNNTYTDELILSLGDELSKIYQNYDFVLIDQSPSSASITNAIFSLTADYVAIPSTPTFFCLQAINNLNDIWERWHKWLSHYSKTYNKHGLNLKSQFLGLIIQQGKRFKLGNAKHTNDWNKIVNDGIQDFVQVPSSKSVKEAEFKEIFKKSNPYIIATYNDFTPKLRSICDKKGLPIVALTKADLPSSKAKEDKDNQYLKAWESVQETNAYICESLLKLK